MPPETSTAPTEPAPAAPAVATGESTTAQGSEVAAPRRDKRLVPVAPRPRPARPVRPVMAPEPSATRSIQPVQWSAVESKVAALQDPHEILNLIRTEATLRRAQRLSGAGDAQRQTIRLLSVFMLFALLVAAVGAMWYLQTSLQGSRRGHRPAPSAAALR